ncbi:hypothetical protein MJT46_005030 [Ovis ammon polii x Ovis aries]|nr:hypothetical protein MJT46_005030 [Ovis ammon polii x Ovis aries]
MVELAAFTRDEARDGIRAVIVPEPGDRCATLVLSSLPFGPPSWTVGKGDRAKRASGSLLSSSKLGKQRLLLLGICQSSVTRSDSKYFLAKTHSKAVVVPMGLHIVIFQMETSSGNKAVPSCTDWKYQRIAPLFHFPPNILSPQEQRENENRKANELTLVGKTDATSGNTSSLLPVYIVRAEARPNCSKRMWAFPLSLWPVLTSPLT